MEPRDEFVHDYPKPLDAHWKENWYFNFIDREAKAWGVNHVSLMRHKQKGRFSAFHVVDNEVLMYSNLIDLEDEVPVLTDGRVKFEFVEPFKKFRVSFDGDKHRVNLEYEARFGIYDYAMTKRQKPGDKRMALEHYEQPLYCRGEVEKDGQTRKIDCLGHRDHSWGYRNESKITGWNWVAVQFPERTLNLYRFIVGKAFLGSGFVAEAEGNAKMVRMNVEETLFDGKVPKSSVFHGVDERGRHWRVRSEKFSTLFLPLSDKPGAVVIHENFSDFEDLASGAKGYGIDEYLINPAG